jgi:hypothetical protein
MKKAEEIHVWIPYQYAILNDGKGEWIVVRLICKDCDEELVMIGELKEFPA